MATTLITVIRDKIIVKMNSLVFITSAHEIALSEGRTQHMASGDVDAFCKCADRSTLMHSSGVLDRSLSGLFGHFCCVVERRLLLCSTSGVEAGDFSEDVDGDGCDAAPPNIWERRDIIRV